MNTKTLGLFAFGIFALMFVMSAVSAVIVLNPASSSLSVVQGGSGSFTFTIQNTDGASNYSNFTSVVSNFTSGTNVLTSSNVVVGTLPTSVLFGATSSAITVTFNIPATQANGTYNGTITIDADGSTVNPNAQTLNVTLTVTSDTPTEITSCTSNPGELKIKKIDFTNNGMQYNTFGEDNEWFLLDEVEVKIDVKNEGDYDISDVEISWGLWGTDLKGTNPNDWVIDFDEEDTVNIDKGDTETLTVKFNLDDNLDVDFDELNDGSNYKFYVVASGTIDDNDAGTLDEDSTCATDSEQASIIIESDFVVLNNFQVPETVSCGANVEISADVWNIGDSDQDEVSVQMTSSDFKINENIIVGDIDAFDNQKVSFSFKVPSNATEKTYVIKFEVLDEDGDVYQNDYDNDYSEFNVPITVKGGCTTTPTAAPVTVTANLVSGGNAGQDLVVKASVTNTGTSSSTYTLVSSGHGQWASTYEVIPASLTLASGQSGDATFTFNVNKDASGEQTFYIEVVAGNQVTRQPVSVVITKAGLFSSITGGAISENAWVWGLGLLNIILILVIIIVAFRVVRK